MKLPKATKKMITKLYFVPPAMLVDLLRVKQAAMTRADSKYQDPRKVGIIESFLRTVPFRESSSVEKGWRRLRVLCQEAVILVGVLQVSPPFLALRPFRGLSYSSSAPS